MTAPPMPICMLNMRGKFCNARSSSPRVMKMRVAPVWNDRTKSDIAAKGTNQKPANWWMFKSRACSMSVSHSEFVATKEIDLAAEQLRARRRAGANAPAPPCLYAVHD